MLDKLFVNKKENENKPSTNFYNSFMIDIGSFYLHLLHNSCDVVTLLLFYQFKLQCKPNVLRWTASKKVV